DADRADTSDVDALAGNDRLNRTITLGSCTNPREGGGGTDQGRKAVAASDRSVASPASRPLPAPPSVRNAVLQPTQHPAAVMSLEFAANAGNIGMDASPGINNVWPAASAD